MPGYFNKLPDFQRTPYGLEWRVLLISTRLCYRQCDTDPIHGSRCARMEARISGYRLAPNISTIVIGRLMELETTLPESSTYPITSCPFGPKARKPPDAGVGENV
jgi:hypothetical protein